MYPARYEGGILLVSEKNYDAGMLECQGLLKAPKKFKKYLYGVRFLVQIDAKMLTYQLNQPASDLLKVVVNRWLVWIRLFDFKVKHVQGREHGGPDALLRRGRPPVDSEESNSDELDDAMNADLMNIQVLNNIICNKTEAT